MPNHVKNVLKFKNLKKKDIELILNIITDPLDVDDRKNYTINFNKIIPEPIYEKDCPEKYLINERSHVSILEEKPWFNWYEWHVEFWGTKWNAYDCYSIIGKTYLILVFSTAWCCPIPVIEQLKLLGYKFELRYADEAYGTNCGYLIYDQNKTGVEDEDIVHKTRWYIKYPEQFSRRLWDKY